MDKELLEALSQMLDEKLDNKLDEKLNPIKKELNEKRPILYNGASKEV